MEILAGLMSYQVLQRNDENVCETVVIGVSDAAGDLKVCVSHNGKFLNDWKWKNVAAIQTGKFEFLLSGIPSGGPYEISFYLDGKEIATFIDILVGDVWILGGQSNMQGVGMIVDAAKPHPQVRAFYMDNRWATAEDPIHNLWDAIDPVHYKINGDKPCLQNPKVGVGPGVAYGQTMFKLSGIPQGLIACAHGGTSMLDWSQETENDIEVNSLYGAMLRRFRSNGQRVAGIIWYQGCNDAGSGTYDCYSQRMVQLVSQIRQDMNYPTLPFVIVQLATWFWPTGFVGTNVQGWNSVREQQRLLSGKIENLAVVPAIDLELDDPIHISGKEQCRLGRRLAHAMWTLKGKTDVYLPQIEIESVNFIHGDFTSIIEVSCKNVMGKFKSTGQPLGFTVTDTCGNPFPAIFRTELKDSKILIHNSINKNIEISEFDLYYGFGPAAHCNIVDEADRSLPAFGPLRICVYKKELCYYIRNIRKSRLVDEAKKFHEISCPKIDDLSFGWEKQTFETSFLNLHDEIMSCTDNRIVFYHLPFQCEIAMTLAVGLGYDGPVKAWFDSREIFFDPEGSNPMIFDQQKINVFADIGKHDLLFALSTNYGKAWGIGLRIYQTDIPEESLECHRSKINFGIL